jgi:hypothetical protein
MNDPDPDQENHAALPISSIEFAIMLAIFGIFLLAGIGGLWKLIDLLIIALRDLRASA